MERKRRNLIKNLIGLVLFPLVLLGLLRRFERQQTYQPTRGLLMDASVLNRPWEDVYFRTDDGVSLNGWFFPAAEHSPRREWVLLFSHGNAGNLSHRLDLFRIVLATQMNLFAYDYRGYGRSEGSPGEEGTYQDARAAYDWLITKGFPADRIIAYGNSLGGGVSSGLATRVEIAGLILQSTFTSLPDVGSELFPFLPVRWLGSLKYDTLNRLPHFKRPVMIIHGPDDSLVRFHHAERNFAAANEPKRLLKIAGDHNDGLSGDPEHFLEGINQFFQLLQPPGPGTLPPHTHGPIQ